MSNLFVVFLCFVEFRVELTRHEVVHLCMETGQARTKGLALLVPWLRCGDQHHYEQFRLLIITFFC